MATTPQQTQQSRLPAPPDQATRAINDLRSLLERSRTQIATALPKHLTAERMIRVALTACHRSPQLLECTPLSIVGCVIQASELGLELAGPLGQAYMVPRYNKKISGKEAIFQVGYRGLIDLALRSGKVDCIPLRIVYTNDFFEYGYGTRQFIKHVPSDDGPPEIQDDKLPYPDNVKAVYAVLMLKGSKNPDFEVMTVKQIEAHRSRYSKDSYGTGYAAQFSPWQTAWDEMAKKTPCRRLAKRAPVSVEFQRAAILDEYGEAGVPQGISLDLPAQEAPKPPEGRIDLRGNGRQAPETTQDPDAEGKVDFPPPDPSPPPADQPTSSNESALADEVAEIRDLISEARTQEQFNEAGARMNSRDVQQSQWRDELLELYQAAYARVFPQPKREKRRTTV